jgi:hypothetical protein
MTHAGVTTADDLFKKELIIGATGFSGENRILPAMLNEYAGTKMRIVSGYTGRSEVYLAMQRGEVDGWASTIDGLQTGEPARMIADGRMKVLLHMGWDTDPDFPDAPNLSAYITDPETKAWVFFFVYAVLGGGARARPQWGPEARRAPPRMAVGATVAPPAIIKSVESAGFPVNAIDGGAVEQIISKLFETPDSVLEKARKLRNR